MRHDHAVLCSLLLRTMRPVRFVTSTPAAYERHRGYIVRHAALRRVATTFVHTSRARRCYRTRRASLRCCYVTLGGERDAATSLRKQSTPRYGGGVAAAGMNKRITLRESPEWFDREGCVGGGERRAPRRWRLKDSMEEKADGVTAATPCNEHAFTPRRTPRERCVV